MTSGKKTIVLAAMIAAFAVSSCVSQMYTLKSSASKTVSGKEVKASYSNVVNYFGYVSQDMKPGGKYKGRNAYYLYVWVPAAIDELGTAVYSPCDITPGSGDFVHPEFKKNFSADSRTFFDTFIALDRMVIIDPDKIKSGTGAVVMPLEINDDTSEIPANPGGQSYNSIIRAISNRKNPTKTLVKSVYRLTLTSLKGSVKGSYLCQIGTNVPGVKIAASLEELDRLVNVKK